MFQLCRYSTALFCVGVSAVYGVWVTSSGADAAMLVFVYSVCRS